MFTPLNFTSTLPSYAMAGSSNCQWVNVVKIQDSVHTGWGVQWLNINSTVTIVWNIVNNDCAVLFQVCYHARPPLRIPGCMHCTTNPHCLFGEPLGLAYFSHCFSIFHVA